MTIASTIGVTKEQVVQERRSVGSAVPTESIDLGAAEACREVAQVRRHRCQVVVARRGIERVLRCGHRVVEAAERAVHRRFRQAQRGLRDRPVCGVAGEIAGPSQVPLRGLRVAAQHLQPSGLALHRAQSDGVRAEQLDY